nr:hypothetical protein [Propionibacterium sp.]
MTRPLPPLPAAWRRRGDRPGDESHLDNLARQLAHRRDLATLPWLFGAWTLAFAAATPAFFGGHPAAWIAVALSGLLAAASALGASGLRARWRREGMPLEYATPWPRGGYSNRAAARSLLTTAAVLAATTLFVALGGSDAAVWRQAVGLAVAVLAFAVTLVLPGVVVRRRRYTLLQDAVARQPDVVRRLQASLDAAARMGSASGRALPFAPPGFPADCLGLRRPGEPNGE